MGTDTYQKLSLEMMDAALRSEAAQYFRGTVTWEMDDTVLGLTIEVSRECPPDNIYVDRAPIAAGGA